MENEIKLNGKVLAESNASGTEEDPIVSRVRPFYTDKDKKVHLALIETMASCVIGKGGKRLDRTIQELEDAVGVLGGVLLSLT